MGTLSAVLAGEAGPGGLTRPCRVAKVREGMDADDRAAFDAMLDGNSGYTHSQIADILWRAKTPIHPSIVSRHRNHRCHCG